LDVDTFLDDTLRALLIGKALAQNGYATSSFLGNLVVELQRAHDELGRRAGTSEQVLADFLDAAIQEINISRYFEEFQISEYL